MHKTQKNKNNKLSMFNKFNKFNKLKVTVFSLVALLTLTGCSSTSNISNKEKESNTTSEVTENTQTNENNQLDQNNQNNGNTENVGINGNELISKDNIPDFDGVNYDVVVNNNKTYFTDDEMTTKEYLKFSELDSLGRCGPAITCVSKKTVANEERGSIGMIKPTGWHTVRYDNLVEGKYLYNRSHISMFKLNGNVTNDKRNLITGTRFFNADEDQGMLHYEMIALNYVKNTNNHLMYRCTPVFKDDDLVASGILMEAKSVEDNGKSLEYCVYVYNEQPGIEINHKDGTSRAKDGSEQTQQTKKSNYTETKYIINTNSKKIHKESCSLVAKMSASNKKETTESIDDLKNEGYTECGWCFK